MKSLIPRAPMMRQDLERFLSYFDEEFPIANGLTDWSPVLDVTEEDGKFVVKAECPGIDAKDLHVRVKNDVLTIEGEKVSDIEEKTDRTYRKERSFGAFSRAIRFPTPTDGTKVKARLVNGVLTLTVPKSVTAESSTIPIQVG